MNEIRRYVSLLGQIEPIIGKFEHILEFFYFYLQICDGNVKIKIGLSPILLTKINSHTIAVIVRLFRVN